MHLVELSLHLAASHCWIFGIRKLRSCCLKVALESLHLPILINCTLLHVKSYWCTHMSPSSIIWFWPMGSDAPLLVKSNVDILLCLRLVGWPQNGTSSQMVKKNRIYSVTVYCFCFWVCDWSVLQFCVSALLCGIAGLCVKTTVYCSRTTSYRLGSSRSLGRTSAGWIYSTATKRCTSFIRLFLMSTVPARCQLISFQ